MNILIAEDERINLTRLQRFLEKWGNRVYPTANGLDALETFLSEEVDIIITDWMMPKMDGLELVKHIRSQSGSASYVYIILLTSRGEREDIVRGLSEAGVDDYIVKPFDPEELKARLTVGERTVRLERTLREYGRGLEKIVRKQTRTIRKTQEETIYRLLSALESRDEETGGHVKRIAHFSAHLAKEIGWQSNRIEDLLLAAPMHDIGKIGVPDTILLKKGRLTDEEFEIIKTHTTIGGTILKDSEYPMLQLAEEIALSHHEKWDGSGYPRGLAGEDIPESGRIVALADVFDALSSDRVYRNASPEDEVIRIMREGRGSHFDPDLFDLFIECLPEFRRISLENP
ncbi:MAG: response regulator [Desulfobacterales bacterium]